MRMSPPELERVREEVADIVIYALHLCNRLSLDLTASIEAKMARNAVRYPADVVRGRADHTPSE
jgi:NTP pyrophosphatase (non-canonical NTP hydrolase)